MMTRWLGILVVGLGLTASLAMALPAAAQRTRAQRVTYGDDGFVMYVNRSELPNTIYELRGAMVVRFGEFYVYVVKSGTTYVFPREHLIFAGREFSVQ